MIAESDPITWGVPVRVYWTVVWRGLVMYIVGSMPLFVWLMFDDGFFDPSYPVPRVVYAWLLLLGAGFIAVRMALRKRYRAFTLQIHREPLS